MSATTALVVGAGVSGLTMAYDLTRLGVDCLVVEKENRLGGLIHTRQQDGFLMDGGPDAFLTQKTHARVLCHELGLKDEIISTNPAQKKVYVLYRGRLEALPEGMRLTVPTRWLPLLTSGLFTLGGKLRLLLERVQPRRKNVEEESVASFIERRFGAEALERVGEPLLAGIHCGDAHRLSMDRLFPQLVSLEERYGSVTRGMLATAPSSGTTFASLEGGMGRLIEALSERLPAGRLITGQAVVESRRDADKFVSVLSSGEQVRSTALVLALPLRGSESLTRDAFPDVGDELRQIQTVSSAVVFHAFRRSEVEHPLDGYGFVVPEGEPSRLLAATFVSTKFAGRAPADTVLLRTFMGGRADPEALDLPDDELIELSRSELARALGPMGKPLTSSVIRWSERTPQVELGHADILLRLESALEREPGLFVLGNGLWSVGIPDCIGKARKTAEAIATFAAG